MEAKKIILAYCLKYANDWHRICNAIKNHEELTEADEALVNSFSGNYITMLDSEYPQRLKNKFMPPFVLYYDGDLSLLNLVDKRGGKNDLIFLHGPNTLRIPSSRLCTITADNKIDICGGLRVWFNNESDNIDRYGLAAGLCQTIVGTKIYPVDSRSWFLGYTITNGLQMGCDIYMVATTEPSYNNSLIKEGCNIIDCYADIELSDNGDNLPF